MDEETAALAIVNVTRPALLEAFLKDPPQVPDDRILEPLATALWTLGRISEFLPCTRLIEQYHELRPQELIRRAYWELYAGDVPSARASFQEVLRREPQNPDARLGRAFPTFTRRSSRQPRGSSRA
jgi:hypothetical protein